MSSSDLALAPTTNNLARQEADSAINYINVNKAFKIKLGHPPPQGTKVAFTCLRLSTLLACELLEVLAALNKKSFGQWVFHVLFWLLFAMLVGMKELQIHKEEYGNRSAVFECVVMLFLGIIAFRLITNESEIYSTNFTLGYVCFWVILICSLVFEFISILLFVLLKRQGYWCKFPLVPGGEGRRMTEEEYQKYFLDEYGLTEISEQDASQLTHPVDHDNEDEEQQRMLIDLSDRRKASTH